jgi:hypothetical protein
MNHNWPWVAWPWVALALLGAYHGLNPAMGWLFALALGLQEKRRSAVVRALLPIALGHAVAITVAILALRFVQHFLPLNILKWGVALFLFALGVYRLFRSSHPRGAGMRVGGRDLFVWSFLMASAHGAGLMLLPVLMTQPMSGMSHSMAGSSLSTSSLTATTLTATTLTATTIALAVLIHTASMLAVAGVLAIVFFETYEKVGLRLLRHTWLNFDLLWAIALLVAGFVVLFF